MLVWWLKVLGYRVYEAWELANVGDWEEDPSQPFILVRVERRTSDACLPHPGLPHPFRGMR